MGCAEIAMDLGLEGPSRRRQRRVPVGHQLGQGEFRRLAIRRQQQVHVHGLNYPVLACTVAVTVEPLIPHHATHQPHLQGLAAEAGQEHGQGLAGLPAQQLLQIRAQVRGHSGVCHTSAGRADPANGGQAGIQNLGGGLFAEFHGQEELAPCPETMGHPSLAKLVMFQHVPRRAKRSGWSRRHGKLACPRADHCAAACPGESDGAGTHRCCGGR